MESKTIFKENDRVYVTSLGWGKVIDAGCSTPTGWVGIETDEGRIIHVDTYLVSFTEYTLDGFSQERPEPLPKPGDVVWVRDTEYDSWMITYFRRFSTDAKLRYGTNSKNSDDSQYIYYYKYLTTKNPYENN
jgi:hypothetical protein